MGNLDVTSISGLQPVFLVGCPRSGTTLLQRMLSAHPEIAIAPETRFIRRYLVGKHDVLRPQDRDPLDIARDFAGTEEFTEAGVTQTDFERALAGYQPSYTAVFAAFLLAFRQVHGARIVGEKTPNHLLFMPLLTRMFPDARFIHIVRDPRAVVNSWKDVPWSTGTRAGDARVWDRYQRTAFPFESAQPDRITVFKYEDLVSNPAPELQRLCSFAGISYRPEMIHSDASDYVANVTREPWKQGIRGELDPARTNAWRSQLTAREVSVVEAMTYETMRKRGYQSVTPALQLSLERMRLLSRRAASKTIRLVRKATGLA